MAKKANDAEIMRAEHTPEAVSAQYRKAVGGLREMVIFGAMLLEVDASLTRETNARCGGYDGETLKGWLGDNCPEVNYKTAMRFKSLAAGLQEACKVPAGVPLAGLLTGGAEDAGPKAQHAAERVEEMIEGKSARQLMFTFAGESPKGGDLGNHVPRRAPTTEERAALAWQVGIDQCQYLTGWAKDSARLLDKQQRRAIAEKLREIADSLRD